MNDTTIKCSTPQKEAINNIVTELGANMTQKDAMEYLLGLDRIKKEEAAGRAIPRLDDIRHLFNRIEGIYVESVLSARDIEQQSQDIISLNKNQIDDLKITLYELRNESEKYKILADEQVEEMKKKVEVIVVEKDAEISKALAEAALFREQATKELAQMELLVKESNNSKEQATRLVALAQEAAETSKQKANDHEKMASQAALLLDENNNLKLELERIKHTMHSQVESHTQDVDKLISSNEVAMAKSLLEAEKQYMNEIRQLMGDISKLKEEKAELQIALERKIQEK
ncbi:hypothetical protein [Paenibacillus sp. Leaf72]|uniref:hypothetical protein n=1 Tax=Paenibacillus sp. Leaf72 TaxID=1736234 RepID=UPI0006F7D868|nr:hypothetical protein [Paenibacillus sp. Leaf72]KQN96775.1 hypothetical protein ASF12_22135 [Paenibacillus sp. Leaf72]